MMPTFQFDLYEAIVWKGASAVQYSAQQQTENKKSTYDPLH